MLPSRFTLIRFLFVYKYWFFVFLFLFIFKNKLNYLNSNLYTQIAFQKFISFYVNISTKIVKTKSTIFLFIFLFLFNRLFYLYFHSNLFYITTFVLFIYFIFWLFFFSDILLGLFLFFFVCYKTYFTYVCIRNA